MTRKTIKTRAKINLALDILSKRQDGYHEVEMIMQTIDLYDLLKFKIIKEDIVIRSNNKYMPIDKNNIVYAAADFLKNKYKTNKGIEISITKNIPISAGLGGGSTNAAGTLKVLNELWKLDLPLKTLMKIGEKLGADIPFCLLGGTALAEGIGEKLTPLPPLSARWLVLVKPSFSVSTAWAYKNINTNRSQKYNAKKAYNALSQNNIDKATPYFKNVFEQVIIPAYPEINEIKSKMISLGADLALMSGSGPTVFSMCKDEERAQAIYKYFKGRYKDVFLVKTYNK